MSITLALCELTALAAEPELPPALKTYLGREVAQTMHFLGAPWLIRESRDREEDTTTLMKILGAKPGDTVADLGCGNGFYSLRLAKQIGPEGEVLAVDIQPEMLRLLKARADEQEIDTIKPILGTLIDPKLPAKSLDLALLVDVYHEFSHPVQMLKEIRAGLKPEGRLALVEFRSEDADVPIKPLHKMSKAQMMKELSANGFKLVGQFDELPWQHVMFFARDDSPLDAVEPIKWEKPKSGN
jgi:SAM-dependent methyltransferase